MQEILNNNDILLSACAGLLLLFIAFLFIQIKNKNKLKEKQNKAAPASNNSNANFYAARSLLSLARKNEQNNEKINKKSMTQPGKPVQWVEVSTEDVEDVQKSVGIKSLNDINKLTTELTIRNSITKLKEEANPLKPKEEKEMYSEPGTLANILVVDDALVVRKKISDLLKSKSYSFVLKNDGWEAFTHLTEAVDQNKNRPDIIITDIEMPNMDGLQLIDSIKKNPALKNIPIIVVSSHVELHMRLIEEGNINGFITKPFKDDDLINQIEYLLN